MYRFDLEKSAGNTTEYLDRMFSRGKYSRSRSDLKLPICHSKDKRD